MKITKVFEEDLKREKFRRNWYWYVFYAVTTVVVLLDVYLYFFYDPK